MLLKLMKFWMVPLVQGPLITQRVLVARLSTAYSSESVTLTITGCNAKKGDVVNRWRPCHQFL